MARKDRLLPPVALKIVDYNAEYMEQHHKRIYKSFLSMRQRIGTEYEARATRETLDGNIYYLNYNLINNVAEGTPGNEVLRWHGMSEESVQEIIDFHNSENFERLVIDWKKRRAYDTSFFLEIASTVGVLISRRYGTFFAEATESDLVQPQPLTTEEEAVWQIYFGMNLFTIVDDAGEFALVENTVLRDEIINAVESGLTQPVIAGGTPTYIIAGNMDRVEAGVSLLNTTDSVIFRLGDPEYVTIGGITFYLKKTYLSKQNFEKISQDDFFDIYSESLYIDWKVDESWWERFIGGLLKFIGGLLNLILDVLINTPLVGKVLEWLIEGVASLFGMTLEEARAAVIQAIVFLIALYFSIPSGGSSMYAYVQWVSSAYSLSGIAGEIAAATYESPLGTIEEAEEEKLKRELENMRGELSLIAGREEPQIRLNRPEEELRVDGNNNSTYNIFRLD